jgi:hypothetical protein
MGQNTIGAHSRKGIAKPKTSWVNIMIKLDVCVLIWLEMALDLNFTVFKTWE